MQSFNNLYKDLYNEWFQNKHYWFSKNRKIDEYLCNKYFASVKEFTQYNEELIHEDTITHIGAILAFDQIPRHHKRLYASTDCTRFSQIAADIAESLISTLLKDTEKFNNIKAHEWCFILLPYRHLNDINKIYTIIDFILEKYNNSKEGDKSIYKRFLKATLENMHKVNTANILQSQKDTHKICINSLNQWHKYTSILHNVPYQKITDVKHEYNHPLIQTFIQEGTKINNKNIIISLSGGVDSCLCLYLAKYLKPYNNIIAVHINYHNRYTSEEELKFVIKYCSVLGIKLYHRTIDEISRNNCHNNGLRDLYEYITREIRFDTYKQVCKLFDNQQDTVVLLGHNRDDCFENIVTNISLKCNYDNLCGMTSISTNANICFWRPLLDVSKTSIRQFAMRVNIPYLHDSTPSWSARGKIRDKIAPALQDINADIVNSFFDLKAYLQDTDKLIDTYILPRLTQSMTYTENGFTMYLDTTELICNYTVWRKFFEQTLEHHISHKCLQEYIAFLRRFNEIPDKKKQFILHKHLKLCLYKAHTNHIEITCIKT